MQYIQVWTVCFNFSSSKSLNSNEQSWRGILKSLSRKSLTFFFCVKKEEKEKKKKKKQKAKQTLSGSLLRRLSTCLLMWQHQTVFIVLLRCDNNCNRCVGISGEYLVERDSERERERETDWQRLEVGSAAVSLCGACLSAKKRRRKRCSACLSECWSCPCQP